MKKRLRKKAVKYIIPIVVAGLILSPHLHQSFGEDLIYNPFHSTEPHCEVFPHSDYNELNSEKGTTAVTGINVVLTFGENNSSSYSY